ncbi:MAG: undecaprenyl-phosphate galactose phosphotransferase WbaP [Alphaproteobacteria bacterium]
MVTPSQDSLAKKLKTEKVAEARYPTTFFNQAERRLNGLLREIQGYKPEALHIPANNDAVEKRQTVDGFLRTFLITDTLALITGFTVAWMFAAEINAILFERYALSSAAGNSMPILQIFFLGAGLLIWFAHTNHYQQRMPFWTEAKKIAEAAAFTMLIGCFMQFVAKADFSRLWLLSGWAFSILAMISFRSLWRSFLRKNNVWQIPTLIIGNGPTAEQASAVLKNEHSLGYEIVAHLKELPRSLQLAGHNWGNLCRSHGAHHVVIALDGEDFANARVSLAQLMREQIPFTVSPPVHSMSVVGMTPYSFLGHDVMLMAQNVGLERTSARLIKRSFDIVLSLTALLVLSPILLLMAALVKLDGGSAFYTHKRIGLNGKIFSCLKFRSMINRSDEVLKKYLETHPLAKAEWQRDHKLRKDPRVTSIGALLRRTSLDELPQIINVLKGDMSIVGPRPIVVAEAEKYNYDIAFYYRVQPGITGLWQVSGRNDVSYADRVRMDSWYVRNWSLWNDIVIIFKTIPAVLWRDGAY